MSWIDSREIGRMAEAAKAAYRAECRRLEGARARVDRELAELTGRLTQAWEQLTVTLVPGLVPEHLNWAAHLLHLPAISADAVARGIADERARLADELSAIEAEPDYREREHRENECAIHIAEVERHLAPLRASVLALEEAPGFCELIAVDYDTPAYNHRFWELGYYRHWKHGDLIVEAFGEPRGLTRFAELRRRYEEEDGARSTLAEELAGWVAKAQRLAGLVARHAELEAILAGLSDRHWAQARARVFEHVREIGDQDLVRLVEGYGPALYAAKRATGLRAKIRYLGEIRATWVEAPLAEAERKQMKVTRAATKHRRPKLAHRRFLRDEMARKFGVPEEGWRKRWAKFDAVYPRLVGYDEYDAYDGSAIWWHLMTGGEVKARFIPEVSEYYEGRRGSAGDAHERALAALADESSGGVDVDVDIEWDDQS